jgi:hypothetical protein
MRSPKKPRGRSPQGAQGGGPVVASRPAPHRPGPAKNDGAPARLKARWALDRKLVASLLGGGLTCGVVGVLLLLDALLVLLCVVGLVAVAVAAVKNLAAAPTKPDDPPRRGGENEG